MGRVWTRDWTGRGRREEGAARRVEPMAEQHGTIDRRTLLKLIGAAGASVTAVSTGGMPWGASSLAHAAVVRQPGIDPFEIHVSDDELEDLSRRLAMTRWPGDAPGEAWAYGTDRAYLDALVSYWRDRYDWRGHGVRCVCHRATRNSSGYRPARVRRGRSSTSLPPTSPTGRCSTRVVIFQPSRSRRRWLRICERSSGRFGPRSEW